MTYKTQTNIKHLQSDFSISELAGKNWKGADEVEIKRYWSGEKAQEGRHVTARLLWSDAFLYVNFTANQTEPSVISDSPDTSKKTKGLWDRDVCEIFVAPNRDEFRKYYEFEVAPTGEWIDLGIHQLSDKRETDWDYKSDMKTATRIETGNAIMAIKIPWKAFGKTPQAGDIWLGNLFRIVGKGATRGYLAWQPTETAVPNFHVPEKFGEFKFVK